MPGGRGTNALRNRINRVPQFGVLRHEHHVQRVEHGTRHVPMEIVGGQVKCICVCQQPRKTARNCCAVVVADADVNARVRSSRADRRGLFQGILIMLVQRECRTRGPATPPTVALQELPSLSPLRLDEREQIFVNLILHRRAESMRSALYIP